MDKKLIYENHLVIQSVRQTIEQTCINLNTLVANFHKFQPFEKIEMEKQALEYVKNPLEYYDRVIINGCGVKPVAGLQLNPEAIATTYGIDRPGFISGLYMVIPGSDIGHKPAYFNFELTDRDKHLFLFKDGEFQIITQQIEKEFDKYRKYATKP
jgi:hypothetical protein